MTHLGNGHTRPADGTRVTIVGTGYIGARLLSETAQLSGVKGITLIDHARYEESDRIRGDIMRREVGRPKVEVQARRARRINPRLQLDPIHARVESVPLGRLRSGVILAAVDSPFARRHVNRAAWRLGVPWIDGRVGRRGQVVRVRSYVPGSEAPCLECGGEAGDYVLPGQSVAGPPNGGLRGAGGRAIAAGMMTTECTRLLEAGRENPATGRQLLIDLRQQVLHVTLLSRDPCCPFDHATWQIEAIAQSPTKLTVAQAIRRASGSRALCPGWTLGLEGLTFSLRQRCLYCGAPPTDWVYVAERIPSPRKACSTCGRDMVVDPCDAVEEIGLSGLTKQQRRRTLHSMGLRRGDVFSIRGPGLVRHFELTSGRANGSRAGRDERASGRID